MANLFYNTKENRLRPWVRLFLFIVLYFICRAFFALFFEQIGRLTNGTDRYSVLNILFLIISLLFAGVALVYWMLKVVDQNSFSAIGVGFRSLKWWIWLGIGTLIGVLMTSIIFGVYYWNGWLEIQGSWYSKSGNSGFIGYFMLVVGLHFSIALSEELIFRGYLFKNVAEGIKGIYANYNLAALSGIILTSLLFGLAHSQNPGFQSLGFVNIIIAGIFFGLIFWISGNLALSIGIHFGWNLSLGHLYGLNVSGGAFLSKMVTVFKTITNGPLNWTGGAFGPEGSLMTTYLFGGGIIFLMVLFWIKPINHLPFFPSKN